MLWHPHTAAAATDARRVTRPLLEAALGALEGRSQPQDVVQVVDAFQVPNIAYDSVRKVFHRSSAQPHLQADGKVRAGRCVSVCFAKGLCMQKGWSCGAEIHPAVARTEPLLLPIAAPALPLAPPCSNVGSSVLPGAMQRL